MRKIVILVGLLMGAAILTGTPANAAIGCLCGKFGAAPVCAATINDCYKSGGVCMAPCILEEPKAAKAGKKHKAKKSKKKK